MCQIIYETKLNLTNAFGGGEEPAVGFCRIPHTRQDILIPNLTRIAGSLVGDELSQRCVEFTLVVIHAITWICHNSVDAVRASNHRTVSCTASSSS